MKITRHCAPDMRQALRAVKEQLGPDAVILSSRRTPAGVEITAAMDFDAEELRTAEALGRATEAHAPASFEVPTAQPAHEHAAPAGVPMQNPRMAGAATAARLPTAQAAAAPARQPIGQAMQVLVAQGGGKKISQTQDEAFNAQVFSPQSLATHASRGTLAQAASASGFSPQAFATHAPRHAPTPYSSPAHDEADEPAHAHDGFPTALPAEVLNEMGLPTSPTDLMGNELKTLRRMLETQLAQLAWNDLSRRAPIHTEMLRELTEIGLGQELAAQVVSHLPAHADLTQARRLAIATLSQQVLVTGDRWLEDGGRVALVGPTGVGKTTTLAKLAVRWVLRYGPRDLALIAADSARLGAQDHVNKLGQLLGAPVYNAENLEELPAVLERLAGARFILIDTPGSSQRDAQLAARLAAISAVGPELETALVLAASTQAGAIAEVVQRFAAVNPASCVLTKVDEAASLGGVLSVLVRARLPISYMSEGQRVPEDLRPARSLELVSSAVQLAHTAGAAADEDLLRRRFGEVAHALA